MQEMIPYLKKDKVLRVAFLSSLLLCFLQILFLLLNYRNLPPLIPLFLQRAWGTSQIADKVQIIILPALTVVLIISNTFLSLVFYKESPIASRILLWGQALFCFLTTLALFRIILLVI